MRECIDSDALVTIGDALDWDVVEGPRHLADCDECRAELETMRLTRDVFLETEGVDSASVDAVVATIGVAARSERARVRRRQRWVAVVEPLAAGVAALIVLVSSGIHIPSITAGSIGFALGAALVVGGRILGRLVPALRFGEG